MHLSDPEIAVVRALDALCNVLVPTWCSRPRGDFKITESQIMRNTIVWFCSSARPHAALRAFVEGGDVNHLPTFLAYIFVAAKTGGLADPVTMRKTAESFVEEEAAELKRQLASPDQARRAKAGYERVLRRTAINVLDHFAELSKVGRDEDEGDSINVELDLVPTSELPLQRDLTALAHAAFRNLMLSTTVSPAAAHAALASLNDYAHNVNFLPDAHAALPDLEERVKDVLTASQEATSRAAAAELMAESAKSQLDAAERELGKLKAQFAKLAKRATPAGQVEPLEARVAALERDAADQASLAARLDAVERTVKDSRAACESRLLQQDERAVALHQSFASRMNELSATFSAAVDAMTKVSAPVNGSAGRVEALDASLSSLRIAVKGMQSAVSDQASKVNRLVGEMGWLLPQFWLQFSYQWNLCTQQMDLQSRLKTAHTPAPFFATPTALPPAGGK